MADLCLANPVDATKALPQSIRVRGQIVVHHQVGALRINAFTCRIGRNEHLRFRILGEAFLILPALIAAHTAMNDDNGFTSADEGTDAFLQIIEGVTMP